MFCIWIAQLQQQNTLLSDTFAYRKPFCTRISIFCPNSSLLPTIVTHQDKQVLKHIHFFQNPLFSWYTDQSAKHRLIICWNSSVQPISQQIFAIWSWVPFFGTQLEHHGQEQALGTLLQIYTGYWSKLNDFRKKSFWASEITVHPLIVWIMKNYELFWKKMVCQYLIVLINNPYSGQQATVRTVYGETQIGFPWARASNKGVFYLPICSLSTQCGIRDTVTE